MTYNSLQTWSDFCGDLLLDSELYTQSIRKIVPDVIFKTQLDDSLKLTHVGFKPKGSKISMLKKYYYNQESIDKALKALNQLREKDKFGSVAFSTIGQEKKFTTHQHCIQSISIRYHKGGRLEYTVFYRACEVIKIFMGDMIFIRDIIMPIFGEGDICFFFCNATLNAMYCPILFIHDEQNWKDYVYHDLYNEDRAFFRRFRKWCEMYFSNEPINYSSAEVIREHIHKNLTEEQRNYILELFYRKEKP